MSTNIYCAKIECQTNKSGMCDRLSLSLDADGKCLCSFKFEVKNENV
jgi:hypothetical protein